MCARICGKPSLYLLLVKQSGIYGNATESIGSLAAMIVAWIPQ